jgi:uroporphyrinogen-III synthase
LSQRTTVVVTRAADQSAGLRERLIASGYEVLEVPTIAIADASDGGTAFDEAVAAIDRYEWVVVTSPNGAARSRRDSWPTSQRHHAG